MPSTSRSVSAFFVALHLGSYGTLDYAAWALLGEVGYQLAELPWKPWLRAGVNAASGDPDATDRDHQTFFNLLPTNHIYYGFADQLALQNVVNPFVQLRLAPHEMLGLNLFVRWFRLADNHDARYSGTGVYKTQTFGFPAQASRGFTHVGRECDVVATSDPHKTLTLEVGWSWLRGGAPFDVSPNRSQNLQFGYVQAELRY